MAEHTEERTEGQFSETMPSRNLPPAPFKDMPDPLPLRKILGPSVILAGLGVGSGEYIIWPYITTQVGPSLLWAAVLGVTVQFFLNMEIERYTLATGETAVSGFVRYWKPWGLIFCAFVLVPNIFPGWATSGVAIFGYLVGYGEGAVPYIAILVLISLAIALTTSPVVYQTLERAEFFKVGLTFVFLIVAIFAALEFSAVRDLSTAVTEFGRIPTSDVLPITVVLSGLVFAGAGGANNLVQSNWIRDKGFGMGAYVPRIVSPITGEPQAEPATGSMMRQDEENVAKFWQWWRTANIEQFCTFWVICVFSIVMFSLIAWSTVGGQTLGEGADLTFIQAEGEVLGDIVGGWFSSFFWLFGTLSLILVAMGVMDYIARLIADVLKTVYLTTNDRWSESRIYTIVVWTVVTVGSLILLAGLDAPLILLVISACLNGIVMFVYSILLIVINRRSLPEAIKVRGYRLGALYFAVLFYGFFAGWFVIAQIQTLFAA